MAGAWKLRTGSSVKRPTPRQQPTKKKPVWETLVGWVTQPDTDFDTGIESWCKRKYEASLPRNGKVRSQSRKNWHAWDEFVIEPQTKCTDIDDLEAFKENSLAEHFKPKVINRTKKETSVNKVSETVGKGGETEHSVITRNNDGSNSAVLGSRPPSQGQACITQLSKPESPVKLCYTQAAPSDRLMSRDELLSRASKASKTAIMDPESVEDPAEQLNEDYQIPEIISQTTDPGPSVVKIEPNSTPRIEDTFNRLIAPPCTPKQTNKCKKCDKTPLGCACYKLEQKSRVIDVCEDELPVPEAIQRHLDKALRTSLPENNIGNLRLNDGPFRALSNRTRTNIFPIRDLIDTTNMNLSASEKRAIRVQESYARNGPAGRGPARNNEKGPFYLTGKDLLQHRDKNLFWLQEGLDMVRFYQKSKYVCPTGFRPTPIRTPLQRAKDISKRRLHEKPVTSQQQYSMFGDIPTQSTHENLAPTSSFQTITANFPPDYRGRTDKLTLVRETRSAVDGRHDWRRRSVEEIIEGDIALLELIYARKQLQSTILPAIRNGDRKDCLAVDSA
ncbi:uncharacterized protein LOC141900027 [Tubulanus polymorphus]|uniref:uncharacterized protein LOC141900027 n=1 Tax=Tubulanus polymorphus TaxID=672921 RepID=UPI003DA5374D